MASTIFRNSLPPIYVSVRSSDEAKDHSSMQISILQFAFCTTVKGNENVIIININK